MLQFLDKKYKFFFFFFLFILLSTVNNTTLVNSTSSLSKIKVIEVLGLKEELNEKIKNKVSYLKNKNIYRINEKKIVNDLNKYSFIEKYKVSKIYPSKIIIHLTKTNYIAKTMLNNKRYIVGSNGKLIDDKYAEDKIELPNIFGKFSSKSFTKLVEKIEYTKFNYNEIRNFYFFPSQRWDIEMKNNLVIKLPKNNLEKALTRINQLINNEAFNNIKIIDLRIVDQLIILNE
tara:strand:- start:403 stop:1095 length:693 start_codon:yes stop_codon:yes gene_type:complete